MKNGLEARSTGGSMIRFEPISTSPTIIIDRTPKHHEHADEIESAWQGLCARNPRYFNGSMLSFDSYDPTTGQIHASVEEYKHHAVRDLVPMGISLLAVTAILTAPDEHGHQRFLLGKRSTSTHRYGGLWELGPSGGVDVPPPEIRKLDLDAIATELRREIREEIGIETHTCPISPIGLVHDDLVGSVDIAMQMDLAEIPTMERNWEYTDCRWVTIAQLLDWIEKHPQELIPTTAQLALRLNT